MQLGVEWVEVCPALAYSLSSASACSSADGASLTASEVAATWHTVELHVVSECLCDRERERGEYV